MQQTDVHFAAQTEEAARRADRGGYVVFTSFLNMAQISDLYAMRNKLPCPFTLFGGHPACERKIAAFYDAPVDEGTFPIACVRISPRSRKFSQELTHRDFLGSVLGLGIKRETVGDIFICDNAAYVFCTDVMAEYIRNNLSCVNRTDVSCEIADGVPDEALPQAKEQFVNVASDRLDALLAAVYHLSRSQAAALVTQGKVFIDARLALSPSKEIPEGNVVSVRGFGRFRYLGVEKTTRKMRLGVRVEVW